jgi:hypothetical protein
MSLAEARAANDERIRKREYRVKQAREAAAAMTGLKKKP